jgi:cysteine desulfurase
VGSRHYLDHASTSPARPEVVDAMLPWLSAAADPGRVHTEGRAARVAVEDAREQVAALLGARPREVVFTSGATEAINAAVWGAAERGHHIVATRVEHSAVIESSSHHEVTWTPVDELGHIDADALVDAVRPGDTALVHVQWGNHEVGTLQPVADVVARCHDLGVLVHVDAAAAAGHVPIAFDDLGADLVSVSAHKLGGPHGVGALLVRRGLRVRPFVVGAEQERARRAGMENLAAIIGFGEAARTLAADGTLEREAAAARALTAAALHSATAIPGVVAYGDTEERLPHLVCVGVDGVEAEAVVLGLDQAGIAVHSGSACSSESLEPSPVLEAMGVDAERSLRVSVGWSTTADDITAFCAALPKVVEGLRALRA